MDSFYVSQAGSGFIPYEGVRYQRGDGFFGRILSGGFMPLLRSVLPYLGRKALNAGANIAEEVLDGKNFKDSALRNLKDSGKHIARDAIKRVRLRGKGVSSKCTFAPVLAPKRRKRKRKRVKKAITKKKTSTKRKKRVLRKKVRKRTSKTKKSIYSNF